MATGVHDSRYVPHSWSTSLAGNTSGFGAPIPNLAAPPNPSSRQRYQVYAPSPSLRPVVGGSPNPPAYDTRDRGPQPFPPHNEVEMTREMLTEVLEYFSQLLPKYFDWNVIQSIAAATSSSKATSIPIQVPQPKIQGMRLVVHGGACMLLHPGLYQLSQQQQKASPGLPARTKTRDVDYILRGFIAEYGKRIPDAMERLKECIQATAKRFNLGADWMNSDADIALPMAHDPADGRLYDPIYTASVNPQNIALHTIFRSSNGFLTLISVTPFWAVSLKLVRYTKWDPGDICLLLRNGTLLSNTQWTPDMLEGWLLTECWAMGYVNFDSAKKAQMRSRIEHAIQTLAQWTRYVSSGSSPPGRATASGELVAVTLPLNQDASAHSSPWSRSSGSRGQSRTREQPRAREQSRAREQGRVREQNHVREQNQAHEQNQARDQSSGGSKSRSRGASRPASRTGSPESHEIFIPPDFGVEDEHAGRYGGRYEHDRGRSTGYGPTRSPAVAPERSTQGPWAAPSHGNVHTIHDPIAAPHPLLANGGSSMGAGSGSNSWHRKNRASAPDPYSMRILDEAIGGVPTLSNSPGDYPRALNYAGVGAGAGYPPVIPGVTVPDPTLVQQQRRKNDKQRKLERQRARGSKWRSMSESDSDESDGDSDDDGNKENRMRDQRQRRAQSDPAMKAGLNLGSWHPIYTPAPVVGRSASAQPPQLQPNMYIQDRAPPHGYPPFIPPGLVPDLSGRQTSNTRPPERAAPRPASRSASSENKRRPSALDLDSPFTPPDQLAQWQFEQQQESYQRERDQQNLIAERERNYYQQRQFSEITSSNQMPARMRPGPDMERTYRTEPAYSQQPPPQIQMPPQYYQPPPPHMPYMPQMQRNIYR